MTKTTKNASQLTASMAAHRHDEFAANFPTLDRSQFASENAYREALIQQHQQMRKIEYQQICLTEGLKAYDVSISICERTGKSDIMNREAWNGCKSAQTRFPDMKEAISDSCYVRIPTDVTNSLRGGGSYYCCAVSSKALESQISAKMGFDGEQNFVKPYNKQPEAKHHRAADGFRDDPACKGYVENGSLWKMIENGKVGPGATIAIRTSSSANPNRSGYHAKTVIAVNYDENHKVKSYVLQGNNKNSLEVVSDPKKYRNIYAADMNRWMDNQLQKEAQNMQIMTTDQLEAQIEQDKQNIHAHIDELSATEQGLFASHPVNSQVNQYADWYIKNAHTEDALKYVMEADQVNAGQQIQQIKQINTKDYTAQNVQTNNPTAKTPQTTTQQKTPQTEQKKNNDREKMRSLLENLNKKNGPNRHLDVDKVIDSFTQQFGDDASKVLLKTIIAPTTIAEKMGFKDDKGKTLRFSREVIERLSNTDKQQENQQVITVIAQLNKKVR